MRSVIHRPALRCTTCLLPLRWCICFAAQSISSPLQLALLTHPREQFRPTSTGNLIHRLFDNSEQHIWLPPDYHPRESVCNQDRECWILHPSGTPMPSDADPGKIQLLLLDGSWSETTSMARDVSGWGRKVSLPLSGNSRYWLRAKQDGERFSTAEALLFFLKALALNEAYDRLNAQFELHVYATLRARGKVDMAAAFLEDSLLRAVMPDILAALCEPRPLNQK